jgi:CrcB protein
LPERPVLDRLLPLLLVGAGGFLGANARYLTARWMGQLVDARFPLGTFVVNVAGSFLLGLLGGLLAERLVPHSDAVRLALGVGFLGAFTTFSTFELESHALLEDGAWLTAVLNITLSVLLGLVAVRIGLVAARNWLTR